MSTAIITSTITRVSTNTIAAPSTDHEFYGFMLNGNNTIRYTCNAGYAYFTTSTLADCCLSGDSVCSTVVLGCSGTSVAFDATTTYPCTSGSTCGKQLIYDRTPYAGGAIETNYGCGNPATAFSPVYREILAAVTVVQTETLTSTPSTLTSVTSTTTSSSQATTSSASNSGGSTSQAWIAGAVIGPIVGIALIAGLIFFLLRRRRRQNQQPPQHETTYADQSYSPAAAGYATHGPPYATHEKNYQHPAELGNENKAPAELGANNNHHDLKAPTALAELGDGR